MTTTNTDNEILIDITNYLRNMSSNKDRNNLVRRIQDANYHIKNNAKENRESVVNNNIDLIAELLNKLKIKFSRTGWLMILNLPELNTAEGQYLGIKVNNKTFTFECYRGTVKRFTNHDERMSKGYKIKDMSPEKLQVFLNRAINLVKVKSVMNT